MSIPILTVRELEKSYGDTKVLDKVSLSLKAGESVAIIGPSGSGKSTLLRCISSLETFSSGEVYYEGVLIAGNGASSQPAVLGRKIGVVFQGLYLWPNKTVLANVAEGPRFVLKHSRREASELARDWLDRLGIAHLSRQYPNELSGGQQQRVAIARALALDPHLMFMDEITSALDVQTAANTLELLASLNDGRRTFVFVTHHLNFAQEYTQRTIVLIEGSIVEEGRSAKVIQSPVSEATQLFLSVIHETA